MGLYLSIAWRNLWRNSRRTLIATASVFFAVFFSLVMRSLENGSYDYMIEASVDMYLGYVQIHGRGYWEKRSLDESLQLSDAQLEQYARVPSVTHAVPRFETFCLISNDSLTRVAQVIGIDPVRENGMTGLQRRLTAGRYLQTNDSGMLVAEDLAKLLGASVGDSIVLYGQGYQGITAAARVPIVGILHFPLPELNSSMTYLSLPYAQWLFSAPGRITSVAFLIDKPSSLGRVERELKAAAGPETEVMNWQEMMPELVQSIEADSAGGIIMLIILYVVIGFGIFGTIMMMTNERRREFGILLSVGMKRWKLTLVTTMETLMISLLGACAGVAVSVPIIWYFYLHPIPLSGDLGQAMIAYGLEPIMPFSAAPAIFVNQTVVVFAIGVVCALYPYSVIRKIQPAAAMRS